MMSMTDLVTKLAEHLAANEDIGWMSDYFDIDRYSASQLAEMLTKSLAALDISLVSKQRLQDLENDSWCYKELSR